MADFPEPPVEGQTGALANWTALNGLYDRLKDFDPTTAGTGGLTTHLYASALGLGASATAGADATALTAFFVALPKLFTQSGLVKGGLGVLGELPNGSWLCSEMGHAVVAPAAGGGDITLTGQTAGGTTLTAADRSPGGTNKFNGVNRGSFGTIGNMTSATRGGAAATGYPSVGNTFTLQFAAPWWTGAAPTQATPLCNQYDPIYLLVSSAGVLRWARFSCTMNNVAGDYTQVQYMGYGQGMAVDGCIPPPQNVYFPAAILHLLNFKGSAGHHCKLRNLALSSGSKTGTPADGLGLRRSSNTTVEESVSLNGFFENETINGTAWPIVQSGGVGQNTDHSKNKAKFLNGTFNVGINATSAASWVQSMPALGTGADAGIAGVVGGGRDNNWDEANMGAPAIAHFGIADDGSIETGNFDKINFKSGFCVIKGDGVRGVAAKEPNLIDGLEGWFKVESPGNYIIDDESKMRIIWAINRTAMRFEAGLAINGSGNPTNFTDQPYSLQDCAMASNVITAKIVTAFGGSTGMTGHGLSVGDAVQIGNAGPNFTLDTTMIGQPLPLANIKVTTSIAAAPTTGSFLVTTGVGQVTVTYTGVNLGTNTFTGCTGGSAHNLLAHATGTNPQTGLPNADVQLNVFNQEVCISAIAADGFTITLPCPQYANADAGGAGTTATLGPIGGVRCGTYGRFDTTCDWDLAGVDRYVRAAMRYDVNTLARGTLRMNRNFTATGPRKKLPVFRVRDAETIKSTHGALLASYTDSGGTVYTNVLQDVTVAFNGSDVGRTVTCTGHLNGGGNTDTVATFIDVNHVAMTGAVTAATGQTWSMRFTGPFDDFGVRVELGNHSYVVEAHAGSVGSPSANAVALGSLLEAAPTPEGNFGVQTSICSPIRRFVGVSMNVANADSSASISTSGTGATALFFLNTPSLLVLVGPGVINQSDIAQFVGSAAITPAGSYLIDDGATNPGQVKVVALTTGVPTAGQRIVGSSPKTTGSAGAVWGRVYPERWT